MGRTQRPDSYLVRLLRRELSEPVTVGAEIGVWRGRTSSVLLSEFEALHLWMVDPWDTGGDHTTMPKTGTQLRESKQRAFHCTEFAAGRRTVLEMISLEAAKRVAAGSLDFVFIDGSHLYEDVKTDMVWYDKVRDGGIVCGHDYLEEVTNPSYGNVKRAVDEFAREHGYEVTVVNRPRIWWFRK